MPCLRRLSTLLKPLAVRLRGGRFPIWKLEEELNDVTQEIDYFVVMLHCVVSDESSPQLLRPLRAP